MKEKLHFCGLSTAIGGTFKSSGFSRLSGLVFVFLFLFMSVESWGQSVGDYRSAGDGSWTSLSSWEIYVGVENEPDGDGWVTPTSTQGWPGQYTKDPLPDVKILSGDIITISDAGIDTEAMGTLTVEGELVLQGKINKNVDFYLNFEEIDVIYNESLGIRGIIRFLSKVTLKLPTNAIINVTQYHPKTDPELPPDPIPLYHGLVVAENSCNNNQQIQVGPITIAFCQGAPGLAVTFEVLMGLGGSLSPIMTYTPLDCITNSTTFSASFLNLGKVQIQNVIYQWTITDPNDSTTVFNNQEIENFPLTENGFYTISLEISGTIFKALNTTGIPYNATKVATVYCGDVTWDGFAWDYFTAFKKGVIIAGDYDTQIEGSFSACYMTVNSYDVNTGIGGKLTIGPGDFVDIQSNIINNGTIDVLHQGSLRQKDLTATFTGTGKNIVRKTTDANILNYSYIYWSSPVSGETFNSVFAANRQNRIYQYFAANYMDLYSGKYTQSSGSPDGYDDDGNDWGTASGTITPGKGYIVMAAGSPTYFHPDFKDTPISSAQSVVFDGGQMNTGNISVPVYQDLYNGSPAGAEYENANLNTNLIGNPYPSAIDIKKLYSDNSSILTGTFYFWEHNTGLQYNIGPATYDFSNSNYVTVTTNGSIVNYYSYGTVNPVTRSYEYIASGQGFMADVNIAGDVYFKNTMRVATPNTSFKRMAATSIPDRLWLNLSQENGVSRQLLVGFHSSTSDNFAANEDGMRRFTKNELDFYSLIPENESRLAIQMLAPFAENKTIPLGINITEAGIYKIGIDHTEGIFNEIQKVFIQDLYTNKVYDLSQGEFSFLSSVGENINDRFVLRFTAGRNALGTEENWKNTFNVYPNPSKGLFNVIYFDTAPLTIELYDLSGKQLKKTTGTNQIDLSGYAKGIYLGKIQTETTSVTKKLVID